MPQEIEVDEVTHPTLGPLKFPKTMPYPERNQLIDELLSKQKTGPVASHVPANRREAMDMLASHQPEPEPALPVSGFENYRPPPITRHDVAEAMPAVLATGVGLLASETGPLAIPIAGLGGAAGKVIGSAIEGKDAGAKEIAIEGAKQGAYEAGGRAIGAVAGRVFGKAAPKVGEEIGGRTMPETLGQAKGKPGGFTQTIEHYLSKTFVGGPLKKVQAAQEAASRQILSDLAKTPEADAGKLAANWEQAREVARVTAQPMYKQIGTGPVATGVSDMAKEILADQALHLNPRATNALSAVATMKKIGGGAVDAGGTMEDALLARSEIGQLANRTGNTRDRMMLWDAYKKLDSAINEALTPEEVAIKQQADTLWRQSYIMDRIAGGLGGMELKQPPEEAKKLLLNRFVTMVNKLGKGELTHDAAGNIMRKASDLEILFPDATDRKTMNELANFMATKYSTMGGATGISEAIARIGVALQGLAIPWEVVSGHEMAAAGSAATLTGYAVVSRLLANPGGTKLLFEYFKSPGAEAAAGLLRAAGLATPRPKELKDRAMEMLPAFIP